jgi:hypothetical protein
MTVPVEPAIVEELYAQLKPEGVEAYIRYIMNRTPADMQDEMMALLQADLGDGGAPTDPSQAIVSNGDLGFFMSMTDTVIVTGTAKVVNGAFSGLRLQTETTAFVNNGMAIALKDAALVDQPGSPALAVVSANAIQHATYTAPALPATDAIVSNGASIAVVDALDAAVAGSPGVAAVAAGALTNVKLTV